MKRILAIAGAAMTAFSLLATDGVVPTAFSLDNVFGDHMVLQQGRPIRFSGTATPDSTLCIQFHGDTLRTTADRSGAWSVEFPSEKAGGPYTARFYCSTSPSPFGGIELNDLWVGEVWVCAGQSNMEYPVWIGEDKFFKLPDGDKVAASGNDQNLRLLRVGESTTSPDGPCRNLPGRPKWGLGDDPYVIAHFSAVGYFFGRELRRHLPPDVRIGLVCAAWGGTRIEPWIPLTAFTEAKAAKELKMAAEARSDQYYVFKAKGVSQEYTRQQQAALASLKKWAAEKFLVSDPKASADALANWAKPDLSMDGWTSLPAGQRDKLVGLSSPGTAWYRIAFDLPASAVGKDLFFRCGFVNDCDQTFLDGKLVGETGVGTPFYWSANRNYRLGQLAAGRHVLAIRAFDHYKLGGISDTIRVTTADANDIIVDLSKLVWAERIEFKYDSVKSGQRPDMPGSVLTYHASAQTPATLYNSMVNPVAAMNVGGVIWYQGCSNSNEHERYAKLQTMLVEGWRKAFRHPELPFVCTQLSAFEDQRPKARLPDDFWKDFGADEHLGFAPIRAVQLQMLDYPYTGVACTIDVGDHSDVHPIRKETVGRRLAHEALRIAYGDAARLPGPRATKLARTADGRLRVTFRDIGAGLEANGGKIGPHLVAVGDGVGNWMWTDAELTADSSLLVTVPAGVKAAEVRYAWSAFPPNPPLYRKADGLPVFPFWVKLSAEDEDGSFSVSRVFTSHMVVPRDVDVPIWGRGLPGADVTVAFADQTVHGKVSEDGMWRIALKPMPASAEGRSITITSGTEKIVLDDCLVGDVWLCGGQSNMEFRFGQGEYDWEKYKSESVKYPLIRWMKIERQSSAEPRPLFFKYAWGGEAKWTKAADAFDRLTCAGYYCMRRLHVELGIPLGFIDAAWNGSRIQPFIPTFGENGRLAASPAAGKGGSFNAMFAPLVRFPVRGFLWYQGCSNAGDGFAYADAQKELVEGWRKAWGRELPFYFVQLCALGNGKSNGVGSGFAAIREGQRRFLKMVPNTGMAVSIDIGNPTDVHARAKKLVGDRLAQLALAGTYGRKIVPSGPNLVSAKAEGGSVRLSFENVGGGLVTATKDWQDNDDPKLAPGAKLTGFVVTGDAADTKGRKWVDAEAVIDGDTVVVSTPIVVSPKAVAYAYCANPMGACNLYNRELLPASPFLFELD